MMKKPLSEKILKLRRYLWTPSGMEWGHKDNRGIYVDLGAVVGNIEEAMIVLCQRPINHGTINYFGKGTQEPCRICINCKELEEIFKNHGQEEENGNRHFKNSSKIKDFVS